MPGEGVGQRGDQHQDEGGGPEHAPGAWGAPMPHPAVPKTGQGDGGSNSPQDPDLSEELEERVHAIPVAAAQEVLEVDDLRARQDGEAGDGEQNGKLRAGVGGAPAPPQQQEGERQRQQAERQHGAPHQSASPAAIRLSGISPTISK